MTPFVLFSSVVLFTLICSGLSFGSGSVNNLHCNMWYIHVDTKTKTLLQSTVRMKEGYIGLLMINDEKCVNQLADLL